MATPDTIVTSIYDQPINAVQIEVFYATSFTINNPVVFLSSSPTKEKILASAGYPTSWAVFNCTFLGSEVNNLGQTVLHAIIRFTEKPITVFLGPPGAKGPAGNSGSGGGSLNATLNIGNTTGIDAFTTGDDIVISNGNYIKTEDVAGNTGIDLNLKAGDATNSGGNINLIPGNGGTDGVVHVQGKLTVDGLIDPTGLVLDQQTTSPFPSPTGQGTVWVKDKTPTQLFFTDSVGDNHEASLPLYSNSGDVLTVSPTVSNYNFPICSTVHGTDVWFTNSGISSPFTAANAGVTRVDSGSLIITERLDLGITSIAFRAVSTGSKLYIIYIDTDTTTYFNLILREIIISTPGSSTFGSPNIIASAAAPNFVIPVDIVYDSINNKFWLSLTDTVVGPSVLQVDATTLTPGSSVTFGLPGDDPGTLAIDYDTSHYADSKIRLFVGDPDNGNIQRIKDLDTITPNIDLTIGGAPVAKQYLVETGGGAAGLGGGRIYLSDAFGGNIASFTTSGTPITSNTLTPIYGIKYSSGTDVLIVERQTPVPGQIIVDKLNASTLVSILSVTLPPLNEAAGTPGPLRFDADSTNFWATCPAGDTYNTNTDPTGNAYRVNISSLAFSPLTTEKNLAFLPPSSEPNLNASREIQLSISMPGDGTPTTLVQKTYTSKTGSVILFGSITGSRGLSPMTAGTGSISIELTSSSGSFISFSPIQFQGRFHSSVITSDFMSLYAWGILSVTPNVSFNIGLQGTYIEPGGVPGNTWTSNASDIMAVDIGNIV